MSTGRRPQQGVLAVWGGDVDPSDAHPSEVHPSDSSPRDGTAAPHEAAGERAQAMRPKALSGVLERFLRPPGSDGFGVAVVADQATGRPWIAVGQLWGLHAGESVRLWGRVEDDPKRGERFRVDAAQPVLPSGAVALQRWLRSGRVAGVGETLAARIAAALGDRPFSAVRDEPALLEAVKGLTPRKRQALAAALAAIDEAEQTTLFLYGLGLGIGHVRRLQRRYGADVARKVRHEPYALAREVSGIGFATADRVALALGHDPAAAERLQAAVLHVLHEAAQQGHTAPPQATILSRAAQLVEGTAEAGWLAAIDALALQGEVRQVTARSVDGDAVAGLALAASDRHERVLAHWLSARTATWGSPDPAASADAVTAAETALGLALAGGQRQAVALASVLPLLVVTGGPGTGKTTILRGVLAAAAGQSVLLAAPTGRAARRLGEACGAEAKTLHRLLEFDPRERRFQRDSDRPLQADVVVVDEASMIDASLAAALVQAVAPSTRLLLVGDADQLPSVGPGAVLADLLASPQIPRVRLDRVYRQDARSQIVEAAHSVLAGEVPVGGARGEGGDFFVIHRDDPEAIAQTLCEVVAERLPRLGFDAIEDVQVLAPMHRGPIGTEALNDRLGRLLNPHGGRTAGGLRIGDKVIQTRNDSELEVYNGDTGTVIGVGTAEQGESNELAVLVRFGDRLLRYTAAKLENLSAAWAVTVHKSQGSEYAAVVVPLHMGQFTMLQRNLLYTAITRARKFAVLVGQPEAIARAVRNEAPIYRHTQLRQLLAAEGA
jgi:exodeoxyribonuclease V alpha subunit